MLDKHEAKQIAVAFLQSAQPFIGEQFGTTRIAVPISAIIEILNTHLEGGFILLEEDKSSVSLTFS